LCHRVGEYRSGREGESYGRHEYSIQYLSQAIPPLLHVPSRTTAVSGCLVDGSPRRTAGQDGMVAVTAIAWLGARLVLRSGHLPIAAAMKAARSLRSSCRRSTAPAFLLQNTARTPHTPHCYRAAVPRLTIAKAILPRFAYDASTYIATRALPAGPRHSKDS